MSNRILKEGYLIKRAMKSGRNWKKRYFVLRASGVISYCDKAGDPPKNEIRLTAESTVRIIPDAELGGDSGFCISTPGGNDLFLKVKKTNRDVAEQWLAEITRLLGTLGGNDESEAKESARAHEYGIYKPLGTLTRQKSDIGLRTGRVRKKTLERVKQGDVGGASASGGKPKDKDLPAGWKMKIGNTKGARDFFVSSKTWEYYDSAQDCKDGKPPLGKALLALLV